MKPLETGLLKLKAQLKAQHVCPKPTIATSGITILQPDWECGECGRVWRMWNGGGSGSIFWWSEVRGPTDPAFTADSDGARDA